MPNIINADNGVVSGTPGLKYTADSSGILQVQNNGTNSLLIDASQYVSATVNGLGKGLVPAEQFYRLNSDLVGLNATGAQNILGVGVTLVGSTVYQFQAYYVLSKTAGSTSHTIGIGFGGTATINNINWQALVNYGGGTSGYTPWGLTANAATLASNSATNITSTTAITTVGEAYTAFIFGTVSINAGGTFIPQYTLSAAPGGAYTTAAGSCMKISPLGASGSNTSIGTWA